MWGKETMTLAGLGLSNLTRGLPRSRSWLICQPGAKKPGETSECLGASAVTEQKEAWPLIAYVEQSPTPTHPY